MQTIYTDVSDDRLRKLVQELEFAKLRFTKVPQGPGVWTVIVDRPESGGTAAARSPPAALSSPSATVQPGDAGDVLARTLWGEARGEGPQGMEAVTCVVMNRVKRAATHFGTSVKDCCQKPFQFSCWNERDPNRARLLAVTTADTDFAQALAIAARAVGGALTDVTAGATHYHTRAVRPDWAAGKTPCFELGSHLFYNDVQ